MYFLPKGYGSLEIICGPMFSGKSEELIRRLKRVKIARQNVVIFKPEIDKRYSMDQICSHDGSQIPAISITCADQMKTYIDESVDVIGVDEVQFIDGEVVEVLRGFMEEGRRVVCAGLDMDFRGEPFGKVPELLAVADRVTKLSAVCLVCGNPATRTQRLIDGQPAAYEDPLIMIGADEQYEARCSVHHMVPRKVK